MHCDGFNGPLHTRERTALWRLVDDKLINQFICDDAAEILLHGTRFVDVRIAQIKESGDHHYLEDAHIAEDVLYSATLAAIAAGADPKWATVAKRTLSTRILDFDRWYA